MDSILLLLESPAFIAFTTGIAIKGLEKAGEGISEGAIKWFSKIFIKNGKPKNNLQRYIDNYEDLENKKALQTIIENAIEDAPEDKKYFDEFLSTFMENKINIRNSKNINVGNINTHGGNFRIGDNYGE